MLVVWQVAVSRDFRRMGLAGRMLDALVSALHTFGGTHIETTVTPANAPSRAMFSALARREGAELGESALFETSDFPDGHEPERLIRIGPIT